MIARLASKKLLTGLTLALATTLAACERPTVSTELRSADSPPAAASATYGATLVECPTSQTFTSSGTVTPLGGVVSAGGTSITVPAGALVVPATITVTVPASNYMEVDIRVDGAAHFTFQQPVRVSISYARCSRSNIDKAPLSVWYIDSATKALLENMGGTDNKAARTIDFTTGHLSGYAVAN